MLSIVLCYMLLCTIYLCIEAEEDNFNLFLKFADSVNFPAKLLKLLHNHHKSNSTFSYTKKWIGASQNASIERLVFLKTHKTGSSTLNRILWRGLCINRDYNCFLPPAKNAGKIWNLDKIEDYTYITNGGGTKFNRTLSLQAWLHHIYYNEKLFYEIVPNPNLIVTIVRNPIQRFISAWDWYEHEKKIAVSLSQFIKSYDKGKSCKIELFHCQKFKYRTGLDSTTTELVTKVNISNYYKLILSVLQRQLFVLVTDRYDESLIILAHYLNWNLDNILYFSQKVSATHGAHNLTMSDLDRLYNMQPYDAGLYVTANYMLDQYIAEYGVNRLNRELFLFRRAQKRLFQICYHNYTLPSTQNITLWEAYCADLKRDNRNEIVYVWSRRKIVNIVQGVDLRILFNE